MNKRQECHTIRGIVPGDFTNTGSLKQAWGRHSYKGVPHPGALPAPLPTQQGAILPGEGVPCQEKAESVGVGL